MGAIDFDPSPWLTGERGAGAKAAKVAKVGGIEGSTLAGLAALAAPPSLPSLILRGLANLERASCPRGADPKIWREIVADALRLRDDGWAVTALALGWCALDLWGHSDRRDGLAVWLRGRPILLLDAASLIAGDGDGMRAGFYRCRDGMPGAKLLWELMR